MVWSRTWLEPWARQLTAKGALAAHGRDELGLTGELASGPLRAALASAANVRRWCVAPSTALVPAVSVASLLCLAALGAVAARIGGAPILIGALRVSIWGVLAMLVTAAVGALFGTAVG